MDRITTQHVNRWMTEFVSQVKKKYMPAEVILFGSRAKKTHLAESDVDILIISDKFGSVNWLQRIADVSQLWDGLISLDVLCYTPEEFAEKKKQIGIVQQIAKEGKAL